MKSEIPLVFSVLLFENNQRRLAYTEWDLQPTEIFRICNVLWFCCNSVPKCSLNFRFSSKVLYEYSPRWWDFGNDMEHPTLATDGFFTVKSEKDTVLCLVLIITKNVFPQLEGLNPWLVSDLDPRVEVSR